MSSNDDSWEGKRINQYEVEAYLARGGMADIYKAYDTQLKRVVCLKIMQAALLEDAAFTKRFQREARTAASLDHPDIIKIFDTGVTETGQPFIVMEYIQDGSLDKVTASGDLPWPLPPTQALKLVKRVAGALFAAHQRHIYHRDLKPQNILMRHKKHPVLTDFGVAAVEEGTKLTRAGEIPGTPYYMSPEQIRGEPVDGRSDIYALGLILYELLAGSHPYAHLDPNRILEHQALIEPPPLRLARDGLSETTYQVVNTCLQKHAANRYQTIPHLVAALDAAIAEEEPGADEVVPPVNWKVFLRQNWLLLALIVLVLVLLVFTAISLLPSLGVAAPQPQLQGSIGVSPTTVAPATATAAPIEVVIVASPTLIPVTQIPSATPVPPTTTLIVPTETAVPPTPTQPPITNNIAVPAPAPTRCTGADAGWGSFVDEFAGRLGCATSGVVVLPYNNAAYQVFPDGLMVWRSDTELVYILYDGGAMSARSVLSANADEGECQSTLKGSFGWLWCTDALVQALGIPVETERNAPDFRAQDFANGLIFTYSESNFYYILFTNSSSWTAAAK